MVVIRARDCPIEDGSGDTVLGPYHAELFSDAGGLTQFGAFVEVLAPGSASSHLHWHQTEDEMVYLLSGMVTVWEGSNATVMHPGDAACFPASHPVGHRLENTGTAPARYMVIGTRSGADLVTYPLTGDTVTIADGLKTYRTADGQITRTAPYHGTRIQES